MCTCTCAIVDCFGSVWKSRNLRNFRCVYYYPVMRANWQTTRKWKWTKLAFIDRRRRRRRWRWRRNPQVWRRFVWMETVSKLPYPPLYRSLSPSQSHQPPLTPTTASGTLLLLLLGSRFALCHQSVDDFQRCQLAHNFVVANGLRNVSGGGGGGGNEQQLCRLGVIKIYAWTAAWLLPYAINCQSGLIIYVWQRSQINARLIFL